MIKFIHKNDLDDVLYDYKAQRLLEGQMPLYIKAFRDFYAVSRDPITMTDEEMKEVLEL